MKFRHFVQLAVVVTFSLFVAGVAASPAPALGPIGNAAMAALSFPAVTAIAAAGATPASPYKCEQKCSTWRINPDSLCSDLYLDCIPARDGPLDTTKLSYKSNNLKHLLANVFRTQIRDLTHLAEVTELDLSWNQLEKIDGHAFDGLNGLKKLNLFANKLRQVPTAAFTGLGKLKMLSLRINPIEAIPKHAFKPLKSLETLEISFCNIATVAPEAFKGLRSLTMLDMRNNRLVSHSITRDSFKGLPKLQTIKFAGNAEQLRLKDINWMEAFGIHAGRRPLIRRNDEDYFDEDYGDLLEFNTGGQEEGPDYYEVPCKCGRQSLDPVNTVTCPLVWKFFKANMSLECIGKARQAEYSLRSGAVDVGDEDTSMAVHTVTTAAAANWFPSIDWLGWLRVIGEVMAVILYIVFTLGTILPNEMIRSINDAIM